MTRTAGQAIALSAALACAVLAGCAGPGTGETASVSRPQMADGPAAAALISRHRAAHGLGPVRVDPRLTAAAAHQALAVARAGTLDHGDFAARMTAYGIDDAAAENLSMGSGTVEAVIARWQASPGHNANLLAPEYGRIGLARVDAGRPYWTLVLAR
jgi:uncharacterized protein YkwD